MSTAALLSLAIQLPVGQPVSRHDLKEMQIVVHHIPKETAFLALHMWDEDTPGCRAKTLAGVQGKDPFVDQMIAQYGASALLEWSCPFEHAIIWKWPVPSGDQEMLLTLSNPPKGAVFGLNSGDRLDYYPPAPPKGDPATHHYLFELLALPSSAQPPTDTDFSTAAWTTLKKQAIQVATTTYALKNAQIQD